MANSKYKRSLLLSVMFARTSRNMQRSEACQSRLRSFETKLHKKRAPGQEERRWVPNLATAHSGPQCPRGGGPEGAATQKS